MTETREVLSCPQCGLVQFRTRNSHCRGCQWSLDDHLGHSICSVPDPVNSRTTAIDNRLCITQIVGRRVREIRKMRAYLRVQEV
jgi:hypothetical protein